MHSVLRTVARSRHSTAYARAALTPRVTFPRFGVRTLITKRYTEEHETVTYDDTTGLGIVTVTEHAQATLGDVVFVELPEVGTTVETGGEMGSVESVKAASAIYAPVSGVIEEINTQLADQPGLLNKSAEKDGWLCKVKLSDPSEMEKLLTEEEYLKLIDA